MKFRWLLVVLGVVLVVIVAAGGVAIWLIRNPPPQPDFDKVGGTVLVYETDGQELPASYTPEEMVLALERRLQDVGPNLVNVKAQDKQRFEVRVARARKLNHSQHVQEVKDLLASQGTLEFRILANEQDDREALAHAADFYDQVRNNKDLQEEQRQRALQGKPPLPPRDRQGGTKFHLRGDAFHHYSWVEVDPKQLSFFGVPTDAENDPDPSRRQLGKRAAEARTRGEPITVSNGCLVFSRPLSKVPRAAGEADKQFEYFFLTREAEPGKAVTGALIEKVFPDVDERMQPCITFRLSEKGGDLLFDLSSRNQPNLDKFGDRFHRHLAIILDNTILTAPVLNGTIRADGTITGLSNQKEVDRLVAILRAGALPVPLKPVPVSETTVEPAAGR